jgi:hypothetical protein
MIIRVLLDAGLRGDLIFMKKGSTTCIPVFRKAAQSHGVLPTAPFKIKGWMASRYPLWTTRTAKGFT